MNIIKLYKGARDLEHSKSQSLWLALKAWPRQILRSIFR